MGLARKREPPISLAGVESSPRTKYPEFRVIAERTKRVVRTRIGYARTCIAPLDI
jgi:hypothetical protein